jgi:methyltransferase, FkbM family
MDNKSSDMTGVKMFKDQALYWFARAFPFLVLTKRYLMAAKDAWLPQKQSYSQYGEDIYVAELLCGIKQGSCIYIDVGANQPSQISNTYLFYRKGFRGILMEPNSELSRLCRRFREHDTFLCVGAAESAGVAEFKIGESSVTAGFSGDIKAIHTSWVPLLPVDTIWRDVGKRTPVFLFSIDTEGFDLNVLLGAKETLQHTACVIVEAKESYREISELLVSFNFEKTCEMECNTIWINHENTANLIGKNVGIEGS